MSAEPIRFTGALVLVGMLSCTIQDDLGSPVRPTGGDTTSTTVPVGPDQEEITPSLVASPDSAYVRVSDTLRISLRAFADSQVTAISPPYPNARITATASTTGDTDTLVTDANGRALYRFTSDEAVDNVQVTFECRGVRQRVRFDVTDTPFQIQKMIRASADASSIKADGRSTTTINVKVINEDHNPVVGQAIQFVSTAGTIAGKNPPSKNKTGQSVTDNSGIARATLTSTEINDTAFITVFMVSDMSMSDETRVAFQGVTITLDVDSSNLKLGGRANLTAQLINGAGEPIGNTPIYMSLGGGDNSNLSFASGSVDTVTSFDEGIARATVVGNTAGTDSVIVHAVGVRQATKINVTDLLLNIGLDASSMQAKEGLFDTLRVKFTRSNGNPLSNKAIRVIRHYQNREGSPATDTLEQRTASEGTAKFAVAAVGWETIMRLEVIAFNRSNDIATAETSVKFIATRKMTINATPIIIPADGSSHSTITVQIKNEDNNPISGDKLLFRSTAGLVAASATTDAKGKATTSLTSDRRNTIATVTALLASNPDSNLSIDVEFNGVELKASAGPPSINSSGKDTSTVLVTLVDAMKNAIVGEDIHFRKQQDETGIIVIDSLTNNRGEARIKVVGTGKGRDTISIEAAGASAKTVINYSSNHLTVDTVRNAGNDYIADGESTTRMRVRYTRGDKTTAISGATIDVSVTVGEVDSVVFAKTYTTDNSGVVNFDIKNPQFASTATVFVTAKSKNEITTASNEVYFRASKIHRIKLVGTPEVISINGDRAQITATAFDTMGNRVKDAEIGFNIVSGPGGGEFLDPPKATSRIDGTGETYLVSGTIPSTFRQVGIVAGDFEGMKSDTVKFTIAGPPYAITIRRDIGEGTDNGDGTYSMGCVALVTDVNGNPVADGTEVTFSLKITGYNIFKPVVEYNHYYNEVNYYWHYSYVVDTVPELLVFEDLNDNFRLDPGEDRNRDNVASRGEDLNGNGIAEFGPAFFDINLNGRRDRYPEPHRPYLRYHDADGNPVYDTIFVDYNGNNFRDFIEPLDDQAYLGAYERIRLGEGTSADSTTIDQMDAAYWAARDAVEGGKGFDIDWNQNGALDPITTAYLDRTVLTSNGKAPNMITYGQSDALRVRVMINAESQGITTDSPQEFVLPILAKDVGNWCTRCE